MRLVIRKLVFIFVAMIAISFSYSAESKPVNISSHKSYIELQNNQRECIGKNDRIFDKTQSNILASHGLGYDKYKWLFNPYMCVKVTDKQFKNNYVYHYYDKNSPLHVFILYDKKTTKYILAKVERKDYLQLISNGEITYIGNMRDMSQKKSILENYISNQQYN